MKTSGSAPPHFGTAAKAQVSGELAEWLARHLSAGKILALGRAKWPLPSGNGFEPLTVVHLASSLRYERIFDGVWVNDALSVSSDPVAVIRTAFRAAKPGAGIVVTVPYGCAPHERVVQPFYMESLKRLLEPVFEIADVRVIAGILAVAARRRERHVGEPVYAMTPAEEAFYQHEMLLNGRLEEAIRQASQIEVSRRAGEEERQALRSQLHQAKGELDRANVELRDLRRKLAIVKRWLAIPIFILRVVRRVRRGLARSIARRATPPVGGTVPTQVEVEGAAQAKSLSTVQAVTDRDGPRTWREELMGRLDTWLSRARAAEGSEVVLMFSGTTFVQDRRGNRPIRMTNVYLERHCPVFFNYYRWSEKEPLPEHPDDLLFQSPIDATPSMLDRLLTADFGDKKKIFFASFPHELMVRYLTLAAQHNWVTVYDARDDWEEFAKVGMAKWYHPGYERYVASHADVVTAVSQALAGKMEAISGGRVVHVVPNGLETTFPRPAMRRSQSRNPVIGYFGHLTDRWFDWQLVIEAAERYPDITFELAGHQGPEFELPPNIKLLGLLGHEHLAVRSQSWSLALIPFKNGPLADAVDPIKVYEYLHLGLPVLTTYFPQCREYPGTTVTESREEFLLQIPKLIGRELPRQSIDEWLAANTWQARVDAYSSLAAAVRQAGRGGLSTLLGGFQ